MITIEKTVKEKRINSGNQGNRLEEKKVNQEILEEGSNKKILSKSENKLIVFLI